jgi:DNA-directed RNA polymerase subunit K/omega
MSDNGDSDSEVEVDDSDKDEKDPTLTKSILITKKLLSNNDSDDEEEEEEEEEDPLEDLDVLGELQPQEESMYSELAPKHDSEVHISPINSDVESDDEDYLQKFDAEQRNNYINKIHPEYYISNKTEINNLINITRDAVGNIIDENHKTNPFLTKYERTRILGQRAKQINLGDKPYISVPSNIIDGYLIAELELKVKKIPVIIRRPIPSGKSEYWRLEDLEII